MAWTFEIIECSAEDRGDGSTFAIVGKDAQGHTVLTQRGWPAGSDRAESFPSRAEAEECLSSLILPVWGVE